LTKIEELVEAIEEYVDEDKFVALPRVVLGNTVVCRAVEALEELRDAAAAADAYREDDTFDERMRIAEEFMRDLTDDEGGGE
jgi:hypothetical protein